MQDVRLRGGIDLNLEPEKTRGMMRWLPLATVMLASQLVAGCSGLSGLTDFSIKDQEWFSRPGRMFGGKSIAVDAPPLNPTQAVGAENLINADGACPGMPSSDATALADTGQPAGAGQGSVALGHTECDVARAIGAPDSVAISNNPRGDRVATLTYSRGARPGIYTFTGGRLTSVEGVAPAEPEKPARAKKRAARS